MNNTDLVISATTAIYKIAPDETVTTLDTGYSGAAGIDWNGSHILVADMTANKVVLFNSSDAANQKWTLADNLTSPRAVAFGAGDDIWALEQTRFFKLPKPALTLQAYNGTSGYPIPTKVYADYDPLTASDAANVQYLLLEVRLNPLTLIKNGCPDPYPAKITWMVEDPDDPSDDTQIDSNGSAGGDNTLALGNYPFSYQWDDWDVYTMDEGTNSNNATVHTAIVDGVSRVMLNFSPYPGDNFKVTAQVSIPVYGTLEAVSPTITIWKKLYIELDSMGQCDGPMDDDDDDAICTDIPQPDITFLANAFRPAYIDVFDAETYQAGQTTPSTPFKYHLSSAAEKGTQGQAASQLPESSSGYWEVEIQGSYEDHRDFDNDPDGEANVILGATARKLNDPQKRWSFVHNETIRDKARYGKPDAAITSYDDFYVMSYVVLHEIAEHFRLADDTDYIMNFLEEPMFSNCHIKVIRRCIEYPGPFEAFPDPCSATCP